MKFHLRPTFFIVTAFLGAVGPVCPQSMVVASSSMESCDGGIPSGNNHCHDCAETVCCATRSLPDSSFVLQSFQETRALLFAPQILVPVSGRVTCFVGGHLQPFRFAPPLPPNGNPRAPPLNI